MRWTTSEKSRQLYSWIPYLPLIISKNWFRPNKYAIQLLTGHGAFVSYVRFHLRENRNCRKCLNEDETNEHILFYCPNTQEQRDRLFIKTNIDINNITIRRFFTTKTLFKEFNKYCSKIISREEN